MKYSSEVVFSQHWYRKGLIFFSLLFSFSMALAASCSYKNFTIGYEISAESGPNASGEYYYAMSAIRCDASGNVIFDSGVGFGDGYGLGWYHPNNIRSAFSSTWMYNMKPFEGSCRLNLIGVNNYYKGTINGINMLSYAVRSATNPYLGVFSEELYRKISSEVLLATRGTLQNDANLCVLPKLFRLPDTSSNAPRVCVANPILPEHGCKVETEVDYAMSGASPLQISRHYNSKSPFHHSRFSLRLVGNRWSFNHEASLNSKVQVNTVLLLLEDGQILHFKPKTGVPNHWIGEADVNSLLVKSGNNWNYQHSNGIVDIFNVDGNRTSKTWPDGRSLAYSYNTNKQLIGVTDHLGNRLDIAYNALGRIATIAKAGETLVTYNYDVSGNLTSAAYPDGKSRQYTYTSVTVSGKNEPALLSSIIDEASTVYASWTYGPNAEAISSQHAGGVNHYNLTYLTDNGQFTEASVANPLGAETIYTFQSMLGTNRIASESHPLLSGVKRSYTYDANGNLDTKTDFNGNITRYSYDTARNLETQRIEASGKNEQRTVSTQWHSYWRAPVFIAEPNKLTTLSYNGDNGIFCAPTSATVLNPAGGVKPIGVLCSKTEQATTDNTGNQGFNAAVTGNPRNWTYTYNERGQILTIDGPRTDASDITAYAYYATNESDSGKRGNLATITNTLGHTTQITAYDAFGNPLIIVDPNGATTTLIYDARQRLISRTTSNETTGYQYDQTGKLIQVTMPDGSYIAYTYDPAHRLTDITDTLGNRIHYTLDAMDNRIQEDITDPLGALTQMQRGVYNVIAQLAERVGAQNQITAFEYDANGNQTKVTDPLNQSTVSAYDALNRLIKSIDPNNGQIKTDWNGQNQVTQVTDPRNLKTIYTIDGLGNQTKLQSPDTGTTNKTYDSAGNVLTSTDAKGQTTTYQYDALNRLTQMTDQKGNQIRYTYDQNTNSKGRLSKIEETENSAILITTQYTYDALGRTNEVTRHVRKNASDPVQTHTQRYTYTNGQLTGITLPSGRQLTYAHNGAGQITQITLTDIAPNAGQQKIIASQIGYHPFGRVKRWTDGAGQIHQSVVDKDGRIASYTLGNNSWQLSYDNASRIIAQMDIHNATRSASYGYDNLDRITGAQLPNISYGYGYDATGNRTSQLMGSVSQTHVIDQNSNRVASTTGNQPRSYAYDLNGNMTSDGQITNAYDVRGRLQQASTTAGTTTYRVNALGQRIQKTTAGTDIYYHYDQSGQLIAESDSTGKVTREYLWLGNLPIATMDANMLYAIHSDHLNTPRAVTNQQGQTVWQNLPLDEPFGTATPDEDPNNIGTKFTMNLRFPGQYFDKETNTHYNYYRDNYIPGLGRYGQSDPIGLAGGINTYLYVNASPLSYVDPQGLAGGPAVGAAIGGAAGGPPGAAIGAGLGLLGSYGIYKSLGYFPQTPGLGGYGISCALGNVCITPMAGELPLGFWPGDRGAKEWGRRDGCGAAEGKRRFHQGVKQGDNMSKPTDNYGVNPETGDVVDPEGEIIGNLNDE